MPVPIKVGDSRAVLRTGEIGETCETGSGGAAIAAAASNSRMNELAEACRSCARRERPRATTVSSGSGKRARPTSDMRRGA